MRKYFYFTFLLIFISNISISTCGELNKCETSDDCLTYYNCMEGYCVHKGVFPVSLLEIVVLLFICALSMIATSAGIGGGAIYSALLMFIENFSAIQAFPVSNFTILFCALTTFYIGVKDKIANPTNKFIDYDLVIVFGPTLLLGTKIGVILNKILPSLILSIFLILILAYSSYKSYKNAVKQKGLEDHKAKPVDLRESLGVTEAYVVVSDHHFENHNEMSEVNNRISDIQKPFKKETSMNASPLKEKLLAENFHANKIEPEGGMNKLLYGKNSPIRLDRIKTLLLLEAVMIVDQLVEGNDKMPSFLGLTKCSVPYWTVFSSFVVFCIWYAEYSYNQMKKEEEIRTSTGSNHSDASVFKITSRKAEDKMNKILFLCFIGGIISGMLGVGGGIVMAPLMLELGVPPRTAATTSNFLLLFTSSAGTILFVLSGQLLFSFALAIAIPCCIASLIGSKYINEYIARTNKNSMLVYCLFYVMIFSLIILPINGIKRAMYDMKMGANVFELRNFCI